MRCSAFFFGRHNRAAIHCTDSYCPDVCDRKVILNDFKDICDHSMLLIQSLQYSGSLGRVELFIFGRPISNKSHLYCAALLVKSCPDLALQIWCSVIGSDSEYEVEEDIVFRSGGNHVPPSYRLLPTPSPPCLVYRGELHADWSDAWDEDKKNVWTIFRCYVFHDWVSSSLVVHNLVAVVNVSHCLQNINSLHLDHLISGTLRNFERLEVLNNDHQIFGGIEQFILSHQFASQVSYHFFNGTHFLVACGWVYIFPAASELSVLVFILVPLLRSYSVKSNGSPSFPVLIWEDYGCSIGPNQLRIVNECPLISFAFQQGPFNAHFAAPINGQSFRHLLPFYPRCSIAVFFSMGVFQYHRYYGEFDCDSVELDVIPAGGYIADPEPDPTFVDPTVALNYDFLLYDYIESLCSMGYIRTALNQFLVNKIFIDSVGNHVCLRTIVGDVPLFDWRIAYNSAMRIRKVLRQRIKNTAGRVSGSDAFSSETDVSVAASSGRRSVVRIAGHLDSPLSWTARDCSLGYMSLTFRLGMRSIRAIAGVNRTACVFFVMRLPSVVFSAGMHVPMRVKGLCPTLPRSSIVLRSTVGSFLIYGVSREWIDLLSSILDIVFPESAITVSLNSSRAEITEAFLTIKRDGRIGSSIGLLRGV